MKTKKEITLCRKVCASLEWAKTLLINDEESLTAIKNIEKKYNDLSFKIMRDNNLTEITINLTRDKSVTLKRPTKDGKIEDGK